MLEIGRRAFGPGFTSSRCSNLFLVRSINVRLGDLRPPLVSWTNQKVSDRSPQSYFSSSLLLISSTEENLRR